MKMIDGLVFAPDLMECPSCEPDSGCDLTCVWEPEPKVWEGDQA